MNQELKMKMYSIYGRLLVERKLILAWNQVKENKGCGGIDGETIETFKEKEEEKIKKLIDALKERSYTPTAVKRVYIPKKNGKTRPLGIPTIEDRIVQQSVRYHHTNRVKQFIENLIDTKIELKFLPPYSSDLNAIEHLWKDVRKNVTHNYLFDGIRHIVKAVAKYFMNVMRNSANIKRLCSFIY